MDRCTVVLFELASANEYLGILGVYAAARSFFDFARKNAYGGVFCYDAVGCTADGGIPDFRRFCARKEDALPVSILRRGRC